MPGEPSPGTGARQGCAGGNTGTPGLGKAMPGVSGSGKSATGRCRGHLVVRSGLTGLRQDPRVEPGRAVPGRSVQAGPQQVPGLRGQGCASQIRKKGCTFKRGGGTRGRTGCGHRPLPEGARAHVVSVALR